MKEGKCFYCKEAGHLSLQCPVKKRSADLKALTLLDEPQIVGKREPLGRVSYLGEIYEFDIADLDLSKLFGGQSFTVPSQIAFNGYNIPANTLADSGAKGYLFMDTQFAIDAARFFNVPIHPLPTPCKVKGFDGKSSAEITYAIILHLSVDGRRFLNMLILITDLGQHDIIIGKNWLAEQDVWLNMKDQRLVWPDQRSLLDEIQSQQNISLPKMILKRPEVNPDHQKNMERRDRLMEAEENKLSRYRPPRTERMDRRDNIAKMNRELLLTENFKPVNSKIKLPSRSETTLQIDIAMIGAVGFRRHTRKKDTEIICMKSIE
jgi:aspartyl protease